MPLSRPTLFGFRFAALALLALGAAASQAQGRFTVSADGQEGTDTTSKLTWKRCPDGQKWDGKACAGKLAKYKFGDAKAAAAQAGAGWRIPTREELVALVDTGQKKPRIDPKAFPSTPSLPFWATKQGSTDNLNAWLVSFANGKVRANLGEAKFPMRLVRSGG